MALQRDFGDREVRKHARLKYLLHDKGIQWFRSMLKERYFKGQLKGLRNEPKAKLMDYLGWHRQRAGCWFVGLPLMCGRLSGEMKAGLRRLVETYQLEIRLTANQDLLLCNIGTPNGQRSETNSPPLGSTFPRLQRLLPVMRSPALPCPPAD